MEQFKISLGVELDSDVSSSIQTQINNLHTKPIKLKIDTEDVKGKLEAIEKQIKALNNIKVDLKTKDFNITPAVNLSNIEKASNSSTATVIRNEKKKQEAYKTTAKVSKNNESTKELNNELKDARNLAHQIGELDFKISKAIDSKDIELVKEYERQLELVKKQYNEIVNSLSSQNIDIGSITTKEFVKTRNKIAESDIKAEGKKFNNAFNISNQLEIGDFDKQSSEIENGFKNITNKSEEAITSVNEFREALATLRSAVDSGDIDNINKSYNRYNDSFNKAKNYIGINTKLDSDEIKQTNAEYKKLLNISKQIGNLELNIARLDDNENALEVVKLTSKLEGLMQTYQELRTSLQGKLSIEQLEKLTTEAFESQDKLEQLNAKILDTKNKLTKNIGGKLDIGTFDNDMKSITDSFNTLNKKSIETINSKKEFEKAFASMYQAIKREDGSVDEIVQSYEKYEKALKKVKTQIDINAKVQKNDMGAEKLKQSRDALESKMDVWLYRNSAAVKQFGGQIESLKMRLQSCDGVELGNIKSEFEELKRQAELAGKTTDSMINRFKEKFSEFGTYFSAASAFSYMEQGIRSMYNNVVELDTAMTNLYKVTDETDAKYEQFLSTASNNAKELGRSLSSYVEQSANWAKMGYDATESAELAKVSSIYSNVAEVDDDTAVSDIVTAMKAYNKEASEAITIIDPLNALSNQFAVSASGLGEGLSRAASTMATSGTDLEHTLALLTGISEITQSPDEAGNFLKTATARIQGMAGKLEELGEEVDPTVDSISKVQTQILNLTSSTSKPVNIFDDNGEFRDYYYVMQDIANIVDELQSTDRAQLYEILFGKNRMNQGAAMIQGFKSGQIDKALESALNSDGSALAEQSKWSESLEASLGRLEASWQSLSNTIMDSDFLKGLIDGLSDFVSLLDTVIDKFGVLPTLITGVFGAMSFKNLGLFKTIEGESKNSGLRIQSNLTEAFKGFKNKENISFAFDTNFANKLNLDIQSLNAFKEAVNGGMTTIDALSKCMQNASQEAILYASDTDIANLSVEDFAKKQKQAQISLQAQDKSFKNCKSLIAGYNEALKSADGSHTDFVSGIGQSNSVMGNYLNNLNGAKASFGGYIKSLISAKAATIGLQAATMALNMGMTMIASFAVQGIVTLIDNLHTSSEELQEAAEEIRSSYKETTESIASDISTLEGLESEFNHLSKGVGEYGENISLTTSEYSRYKDIVNQVIGISPSLCQGFDNEGNAIANNNDLLENAIELLKEKQRLELMKYTTDDALKKSGMAYVQDMKDYKKEHSLPYGDAKFEFMNAFANATARYRSEDPTNTNRDIFKLFDPNYNISTYNRSGERLGATNFASDYFDQIVADIRNGGEKARQVFTEEEINMLVTIANSYNQNVAVYENDISNMSKMFNPQLQLVAQTVEGYSQLSDAQKSFIATYINGFKIGANTTEDDIVDMKHQIHDMVSSVADEENGLGDTINNLFSLDKSKMNIGSYLASVKKAINLIAKETGMNADELFSSFGFEELTDKINAISHEFSLSNIFKNGTSGERVKESQDFHAWVNSLSQEDLDIVYDIAVNTETADYKLKDWQNALANYEIPEELKVSFADLMGDEDFTGQVDAHIEQINTLQEAYKSFGDGEFSKSDFIELVKQFPELADNADDLDVAIEELLGSMNNNIATEFGEQFGKMKTDEDVKALQNFQDAVLELGKVVGDTQFSIDISAESEDMESLTAAMKESVSSTGLTAESISKLKARYKDLDNYNASELFERTTNGIHLNTKALRELEAEYKKTKKTSIDNELQELVDKYNELTKQIENTTDASEKSKLYAQRSEINDQINDVADLAAQYEGLTSAYHLWEQAQSNGDERDMYASIYKGKEEIDEEMSRGWLDEGTKAYIDLLSFKDLSTATFDEIIEEYKRLNQEIENTGFSALDFFTVDEDGNETSEGVFNFFDAVIAKNEELQEKTGKANPFAWIDENENYHFDFGVGGDEAVAEALGISEELVQIILRASEDAGFEVHLDSAYTSLNLLETETEKAVETVNKALSEMGEEEVSFNFNATDVGNVENQIKEAQRVLNLFKNTDGTVNLATEGAEEAQQILVTLISQKQQLNAPSVMSVNTAKAKGDIGEVITLLQDYQTNYNNLEIETAIGVDTTETQANIQGVIQNISTELDGMSPEIKAKLGLDEEGFNTAVSTLKANINAGVTLDQASLETVKTTINLITPEMMVKAGLDTTAIDGYIPEDESSKVVYQVDDAEVDKYVAPNKTGTVTYFAKINEWTVPTRYGQVIYKPKTTGDKEAEVNGTAHVSGTAYARGNWGTKKTETALTGELGRELIVYGDRYWTVGDNGAEFTTIPRGAIVFNHKQTEELLSNGHVTSNGGRGKAYANGTFSSEGKAFSHGGGVGRVSVSGSVTTTTTTTTTTTAKTGETSTKDSGSDKEAEKEFKETFDWIEIAIDRIERAISKLDLKVNSTYKKWSTRNEALTLEISKVEEEIDLQEKAYQRYLKEANSVGLSSSWAKKVREGKVDIETITDEDLAEKISSYKNWYEKAIDCKDTVEELKETEAELYETAFQNVVTQYENILSVAEHEKNMLDSYISQAETKGHIVSGKYYEALIDNEEYNLEKLREEKSKLVSSLENAVNSGYIKKYSESWYDMVNQIDEITLSIEESNEAILEYNNSIREIEWSIFDLLQEKISGITKESEFLIDLMSNDKLYDDRGQLTDEGLSTMGLHGVNYNTYLAQAEKYAEEMLKIEEEIANDPYDQELINRKQELLELQQEMILASENEKQAIVDMVSEGIELELDALDEVINKYKEALNSEKDLYDYQKKLKSQTSEISSLEKQMSAYQNDDSEESKSKIQQLKVELDEAREELEETEFDKYISDQESLLDSLYTEYEEILNARLDNIDQLISDMILEINSNATLINDTLSIKADEVGYILTETMSSIWNTGSDNMKNVLTTYGDGIKNSILTAGTTLSNAIVTMNTNINGMIAELNRVASSQTQTASTSSAYHPQDTTSGSNSNSNKSNNKVDNKSNNKSNNKTNNNNKSDNKTNNNNNKSNDIKVGSTINAKGAKIYEYAGDKSGETQYFRNDPVYTVIGEKNGYVKVRWHELDKGTTGWFKKSDIKSYSTGKRNFLSNEIAWTQDGGAEMIIRPSDGAILTPLAKGDSVLNAQASGNIWNMANNPSEFIRDNLGFDDNNVPIGQNNQTSYNQTIEKVVFDFKNVKNYEQMLSSMQHDKNFERLISAMTIDRMAGKSSLSKGKAIR